MDAKQVLLSQGKPFALSCFIDEDFKKDRTLLAVLVEAVNFVRASQGEAQVMLCTANASMGSWKEVHDFFEKVATSFRRKDEPLTMELERAELHTLRLTITAK